MKFSPTTLLLALLTSCSVTPPQPPAQTQTPSSFTPITQTPAVKTPSLPPKPTPALAPKITPPATPPASSKKHLLKVRTASLNGTTFTAVTFDRRDYSLKVIDQKGGPGSQYQSAQAAGQGSLAAINGGFFTPAGKPLGLVITNGETRGALNTTSSLGTGILDGKNLTLASRKNYKKSSELLQAGPRLLWPGVKLTGLSTTNDRPRSLLIWDGKNHFGLVYANSATLQGLSNNLKSQPLPGFKITHALNLDGGTSCDLWISSSVPGGGLTKKSFFNKKARNYLALQKR